MIARTLIAVAHSSGIIPLLAERERLHSV